MKKLFALLLACLMLIPALAACSNSPAPAPGETNGETNGGASTDPETEIVTDEWGRPLEVTDLDTSKLNFNNETFTILCAGSDETSYWAVDPGLYKEPSDALEMALYKRNKLIEQDLNLTLRVEYKPGDGVDSALNKAVENDAKSGLGVYDMVINYSAYAVAEQLRPYYIDLMAATTPYIDLDASWYNQNFIENTQAFNHLYYIVGDYNLCTYNRMMATYVNLSLCTDYEVISDVSGDELYDMVIAGDWTYNVLFEYAKIYDNTNGNDGKDQDDIYGLLSNGNCEAYDGFLYAFDLDLTVTNDDGTHAWNIAGNEKFDTAMQMMQTLYQQEGVWMVAKSQGSIGTSVEQYEMFANGHALFDIDVIYRYAAQNKAFRAMKQKYGLLPLPKYDSNQTNYGSGVQDSHSFTSLLNGTTEQNERRCAYMEYAYYLSYRDSRPYYFERIMKAQYLGTSKAAQVFDIVLDNAAFDFGEQYQAILDGAKYHLWRGLGIKGTGTVSGAWETHGGNLTTMLEKLDAWFLAQ